MPPRSPGTGDIPRNDRARAVRRLSGWFSAARGSVARKGLRYLLDALELARHRPLEATLIGEPDPSLDPAFDRLGSAGSR